MKQGDVANALQSLQMAQAVQSRVLALARKEGGPSGSSALENERVSAAGKCSEL